MASVIDADAAVTTGGPDFAEQAAKRAGVVVREASAADVRGISDVLRQNWGSDVGPDPSVLQAVAHAGNTVLVAFDAAGPDGACGRAPVGASVGFLGWSGGIHVHSHMTAIMPGRTSAGIGYALKLRQREICLEHAIDEIRWTFDPLIRRNARFDLVKLGAEIAAYHPDFYGALDDEINGNDRTDRFELRWRLNSPRVKAALEHRPQPEWPGEDGLALEPDFETLRREHPDAAIARRAESAVAFADCFARGLRPELTTRGDYVFTAANPDTAAAPVRV
ncbi:MAG: hypothetical protein ACRDLR_10525, partial [Gaiellaceae bacterium]